MVTLKDIVEAVKQVAVIARDTEENRQEVRRLREQLAQMAVAMERLADRMDYALRLEREEREKHALRMEVEFLKFKEQMRQEVRDAVAEATKGAPSERSSMKALPPPQEPADE